ncbi:DUF2332 family protein [Nocardia lasii]|uniref:DUF2332 family protein n=1 Tax=Nocardia lasii TaxID=1616107 RepID=A0ABW1JVR3_9NOCA
MELAQRFRDFALREARDNSALYHRRALDISADPVVLALINELPTDKRQPNLVLAAARVNGATAVPYAEYREQVRANWAAISATALRRRTQTNEAGRAATLLPVLTQLPGPLALVEVGTSAGLCLYPDRFSYRYDATALDPLDGPSRVMLTCTTTGPVPIPDRLPGGSSTGCPPRDTEAAARLVLALDDEPLAYAGPHGQSLDWFGPA